MKIGYKDYSNDF